MSQGIRILRLNMVKVSHGIWSSEIREDPDQPMQLCKITPDKRGYLQNIFLISP